MGNTRLVMLDIGAIEDAIIKLDIPSTTAYAKAKNRYTVSAKVFTELRNGNPISERLAKQLVSDINKREKTAGLNETSRQVFGWEYVEDSDSETVSEGAGQIEGDIGYEPKPTLTGWMVVWALGLLSLSWLSLAITYFNGNQPMRNAWEYAYNLIGNDPWNNDSGLIADAIKTPDGLQLGGYIEAARSLIAIFIAIVLIPANFANTTRDLLSIRDPATRPDKNLLWCRRAIFLVAIVLAIVEVPALISSGENGRGKKIYKWAVEKWKEKNMEPIYSFSAQQSTDYIPYRWYIPYAVINYCVVVPIVCVLPTCSFLRFGKGYVSSWARTNVLEVARRYLVILMWMCIWLFHESWVGLYTLSPSGFTQALAMWIILVIPVAWVYFSVLERYEKETSDSTLRRQLGRSIYSRIAIIAFCASLLHLGYLAIRPG